jgi:GDP-L-fucose synthase
MKKIFVAGHRGMVGSAIVRQLQAPDACELVLRTRSELDLTSQQTVA